MNDRTPDPIPAPTDERASWHNPDPDDATLERLRAICLPLPEATETGGVGSPSYKVRDKIFAMRHLMRLPDGDRPSVWFKGRPGLQAALTRYIAERYAVPPYVGHRGWIAAFLDGDVDWDEVADLIEESYRMTAPKRLIARLDAAL